MYEPRFHIVLHEPRIPHNTGSVGRTCVALAAKLWLVRPLGFQLDDYYLRRAGLDYWPHLAWEAVDDWQQLSGRLSTASMWFFTKRADQRLDDIVVRPGETLVFGDETQGLPAALLDPWPERCVRIPIRPEARSLNLSNAVAIALYQATSRLAEVGQGSATTGDVADAASLARGLAR